MRGHLITERGTLYEEANNLFLHFIGVQTKQKKSQDCIFSIPFFHIILFVSEDTKKVTANIHKNGLPMKPIHGTLKF